MAANVEFDAATHTYRVGGKVVPSVTQILKVASDGEFDGIPAATLEAAREFGVNLHTAVDLFNRGELDESSLAPALAPYLYGWKKFLAESGAVVIASEEIVYHPVLKYAGTVDVVLHWNGKIVMPDLKSTHAVPRTVGAQTAGYAAAWAAMRGDVLPQRGCVHLQDGTYKYHRRTDPADWALFQSCLNVHNFRRAA